MVGFVYDLIADHHGKEAAEAVCRLYGGRDISVPRTATATHPISHTVGVDVLETLVRARGGEKVYVPFGNDSPKAMRQAALEDAIRNGLSTGDIVRTLRVSRNAIAKARQRLKSSPPRRRLLPS